MVLSILNKLKLNGKIDIVDCYGEVRSYGKSKPYSRIRLINKSIQRKLFRNPNLYLGEGYMNGEIIIEEGSLEDFINIVTSSYDDFVMHNVFFRMYEKISAVFRPLHQFNKLVQSKKKCSPSL